jgi:23S rRNA pseudouridine1911/1915/1917 synthase
MSEEYDIEENIDESEELFEHHRIVADPGQQPLRVDKFLMSRIANVSRNKLQVAAKCGYIRIDGESVKSNFKVRPGHIVTVELPQPVYEFELVPEKMDLNIIYEDDTVIVLNKPTDLVVHPGHGNYTGTLVNGILHHLQNLPSIPGSPTPRPGLVHRLDKDTTGLMVLGKTERSLTELSEQFFERTVDRRYHALVWGDLREDGTIEGHVGRSRSNRTIQAVYPEGEEGKHAVTHYRILERLGPVTLVECKLETGRTHQIRVHMQHLGHPLFGDPRYGGNVAVKGSPGGKYNSFLRNCFSILPRQALHAKTLGFTHPKSEEFVSFDSDIPADMAEIISKWKIYLDGIAR